MFQKYGKAIIAVVYAAATVAIGAFTGDHHIDPSEGIAVAIALCTALLTYVVPLVPSAPWTKTAVGVVLGGLQVAATVIVGGIDFNDWLLILAAVASALGITLAPAISPKTGTAAGVGTSMR
jgi:hypothetical protein